ncbi:hypothetical protein N483_17945 [Pseudoalteromonas luteoviolacea NCIMB 1944]|nr:hypothetical protein N483_17945 [Pseudoalteromonas luteoviolacea NCIMB 1944]
MLKLWCFELLNTSWRTQISLAPNSIFYPALGDNGVKLS